MLVTLPGVNSNKACAGAGCGDGYDNPGSNGGDGGDTSCPANVPKGTLKEEKNEGCKRRKFVNGMDKVTEAIADCLNDPDASLSINGGGGGGGGLHHPITNKEECGFGSGFYFVLGPPVVTDTSGGGSSGGDAPLAVSPLQRSCSRVYADALCTNAGYPVNDKDTYELCTCEVSNLYAPPSYKAKCVYGRAPDTSVKPVVTEALIEQNCASWCPDPGSVQGYGADGKASCPTLLPACACKNA